MRMILTAIAASVVFAAVPATAATVIVDARANSTSGGTSVDTGLTFAPGTMFKVHSRLNDLWSSGTLPRYSDANGIVYRTAVAGDDSGQAPGTVIGINYGTYTQGGATANYGTLVADLGLGAFQVLGANGTFTSAGGPLKLSYLDSNASDNTGSITFKISAVPEPATWAMMILGMGAVGGALRFRRRVDVLAAA